MARRKDVTKEKPEMSPEAEKRLEEVREKVAPTLARIAIQVHLDEERKKAAEAMHRRNGTRRRRPPPSE